MRFKGNNHPGNSVVRAITNGEDGYASVGYITGSGGDSMVSAIKKIRRRSTQCISSASGSFHAGYGNIAVTDRLAGGADGLSGGGRGNVSVGRGIQCVRHGIVSVPDGLAGGGHGIECVGHGIVSVPDRLAGGGRGNVSVGHGIVSVGHIIKIDSHGMGSILDQLLSVNARITIVGRGTGHVCSIYTTDGHRYTFGSQIYLNDSKNISPYPIHNHITSLAYKFDFLSITNSLKKLILAV